MVTIYRRGSVARATLVAFLSAASTTTQAEEIPTPGSPLEATPQPRAPSPAEPVSPCPLKWGAQLLSSWVGEDHGTTVFLTPQAQLDYQISDDWHLGTTWALSWLLDNQGISESLLKLGNPLIEGGYRYTSGNTHLAVRLGVTLPIVTVPLGPDGRLHAFMVNQNLAMTGMWNAWQWLRDYLAIPLQARLDQALRKGIVLQIDGALIPILGVRSESSNADLMAQASLAFRLALTPTWDMLPRIQGVLLPSKGLDRFQSALGLRIVLHRSSRYFLDTLVKIGKPNGIGGGMERFGLAVGKEIDL